jgi:hypothetical protein
MNVVSRFSLSAALVAVVLDVSGATTACASESTDQCLDSYELGQRRRQAGDLIGAARELRVCGGPACPARVQNDCQRWLDDVERSTPTLVFRVRDDGGELLTNVSVSIDGEAPRRLDGRALLVNPGEHEARFERAGFLPLLTNVFVMEGEKLEPREVKLEPVVELAPRERLSPIAASGLLPASPAAADAPSSPSPWPIALAALGVAGGAGFVYFGVRAKTGETDLERCSPDCSQAQVDDVKQHYLLSNVALGVGLGGLLGAGLLLLLDDPAPNGSASPLRRDSRVGSGTGFVAHF